MPGIPPPPTQVVDWVLLLALIGSNVNKNDTRATAKDSNITLLSLP
jgi:hypothetical protein